MTDARALVSCVIPVYNGAAFVAEAIGSVLSQTYEPLECIVVDDGSTDDTAQVVGGFGEQIRQLRESNRGAAAARNAGTRAARGQFVAFLDADDIWEATKLERQMALFRAHRELALVYCGLRLVDREGKHLGSLPPADPLLALRNTLLAEPPFISLAQTGVIPRHVLLATGGFDERLLTGEDSDLAWRLAVQFPIAAVPEPLASYRSHPAQKHLAHPSLEHDRKLILRKAFNSNLLPAELQSLERRARANLAFDLASALRREHRLRALAQVWDAFRISPLRSIRWMASFAARRLVHRGAR